MNASGDVCIEALAGNLNVSEDVIAGDELALRANGSIVLGDTVGNTNGQVTAGTTAALAALNGDITDGNAANNNVTATNLVMTATGGIGSDNASANDNAIETNIDNLAANAGTGDVNIDEANGLTVTELTDGLKGIAAVGVTAGQDVCLDVLAGDLAVNENVTGGDEVALRANGNVTLGESGGSTTGVVRGTTVGIAATTGNITDGNAANNNVTATSLVMTAGGGIGSDAAGAGNNAIEIDATNLAANAGTGDVDVTDLDTGGDGLTIASVTDGLKGIAAVGVTAGQDICLDVVNGNLNINEDVTAGGAVALQTQDGDGAGDAGDVIIGNDNAAVGADADVVTAQGGVVSIVSANNVTDNNGANNAALDASTNVVIDADGAIAGTTDALEINAVGLAANAGGNVIVDDLAGDLQIVEDSTLKTVNALDGVTAGGDVCIDATAGNLDVANRIVSDESIALDAQGNVTITGSDNVTVNDGGTGTNAETISIEAGGEITSPGTGVLDANNVVLDAGTGIGNTETIEIDATNLAARSMAGSVDITDLDTSGADGLTVGSLNTIKGGNTIAGVTTVGDICIDVVNGDLNIDQSVRSTNGSIALRTQDVDGLGQDGDINFNAFVISGNIGPAGTVSVESASQIETSRTPLTIGALDVVLLAEDGIGTNGTEFGVDTARLAAQTTNGGDINIFAISATTAEVTIAEISTLKGGVTVTGVSSAEDVCLLVLGDGLQINENVVGGTSGVASEIALDAGGTITIGDGAAGDQVRNATADAGNRISLLSINGSIVDNNGAGNAAADANGGDLVAAADGGSIGTTDFAGTAQEFEANAARLSADAADDVNININENVTAGTAVALQTQDGDAGGQAGDIIIGNGDGDTVTAQNGVVSIVSANNITDNNGANDAALNASTNVVLDADGEIGGPGANDALEIEAVGLAANADAGRIYVDDLSGDLQIVEDSTLKTVTALDGVTAGGDICIDATAGTLDVANRIVSNESIALDAQNNVNITGTDNITVNDGGAGPNAETISIEAGAEITSPGTGIIDGNNVVLEAGTGIGNTDAVEMDADNFAAQGGTGRVNLRDVAGGARVTSLTTIKGGDPITGVNAGQDVCLEIIGGDLTIDEVVNAGTIAALKADGNINSNATATATNKVSVESTGGAITDGNAGADNFVGDQVVLKANGDIGSKTDAVDIDSNVVAAQSVTGEVNLNETNGNMNIGTVDLEKAGGTIASVTAATDICLTADDGTVNYAGQTIQAGNEIAIRTRDTLRTDGTLITSDTGKVSIEVTAGGIVDDNGGRDITTGDAVLKANGSIGDRFNPIDLNVNRLAAESTTGSVSVTEENGLAVKPIDLAKGGGTVNGITAAQDVQVIVDRGNLELDTINAGNDVRINVRDGDVLDCNGNANNITAGGDVTVNASGCADGLGIAAGGQVVVADKRQQVPTENTNTVSTPFVPVSSLLEVIPNLVLPPGVFAHDNASLGEEGFYLDELYGYVTPEQFLLIVDRFDLYDYARDKDFLLEKHPDSADDEDNNGEGKSY